MQIRRRFIEIGENLCRHFQRENIVEAFPGRSVQCFQNLGNIVCMVIVEVISDHACRFSAADDRADIFFKISIMLCGCGDRSRFRGACFLFVLLESDSYLVPSLSVVLFNAVWDVQGEQCGDKKIHRQSGTG